MEWGQNHWLVSHVEQGLEWGATLSRQSVFALMLGMLLGRVWQTFVVSRWRMQTKITRLAWWCVGALLVQNGAGWLADAWGMATAFGLLVASAVAYVVALAAMHRRLATHDDSLAHTHP